MNETHDPNREGTPVDDVRTVREKIAAQHAGDLRGHQKETNRLFEMLRTELNLTLVSSPPATKTREQVG